MTPDAELGSLASGLIQRIALQILLEIKTVKSCIHVVTECKSVYNIAIKLDIEIHKIGHGMTGFIARVYRVIYAYARTKNNIQ